LTPFGRRSPSLATRAKRTALQPSDTDDCAGETGTCAQERLESALKDLTIKNSYHVVVDLISSHALHNIGLRVVVEDAVCSSSDAGHDALMTMYRMRFHEQIDVIRAETLSEYWV
jgi:hypothetical protein